MDPKKLPLGPAPLDEEWIPKTAVLVLVDLMAVICSRPKGMFKDCTSRIISGLERVNGMTLCIIRFRVSMFLDQTSYVLCSILF